MINNVTVWLRKTASRFPDRIAFGDEKRTFTYGELDMGARAIATAIINRDIFKESIVVFLEKGADAIVSFMASAYSGNFYTPIDTDMPINRIKKIVDTLNPKLVITVPELKEAFCGSGYDGGWLLLDEAYSAEIEEHKIAKVQEMCIDTDILYVLFTSGSTGTPKGVTINHRSVIDYIDWVTCYFNINETDIFGNQAPFYFDNSILDIYCCIKTGAACYIIPKMLFPQPVRLLEYIREKHINTIFWVPSALIVIAKVKAFRNVDLSDTLKRVLFCGEVMPNKQLNIWRRYLPNVLYANLYGPTEVTDACTYYVADRPFLDEDPLPIGFPIRNTDVFVLNEMGELAENGESGELCVRGTSIAMGYYNNPEKTKEVFVQNPLNLSVPEIIYRTGDIVRYNERGELIFLARKDFQIKHLGHRIELGEIETAVQSIENVDMCCCLYDDVRKKIVLFLDKDLDKSYINKKISVLIPEYMLPEKIICMKDMPLNANGKIDRVRLKELLQ